MGKHEWARTAELEFGLHMFVFAILTFIFKISLTCSVESATMFWPYP